MRERLLNPKSKIQDIDYLPTSLCNDGEYYRYYSTEEKIIKSFNGCQCFKDCSCAEKEKEKESYIKFKLWFRNVKFDGTDRCFYSQPYTPNN